MVGRIIALLFAVILCAPAWAQPVASTPSEFCAGSKRSLKFNDVGGFSNVAMRQGDYVKVYREIASSELDWAIYDTYLFFEKTRTRIEVARVVIYAGNPIVYVEQQKGGEMLSNKRSLPDGMFIPSAPYIKNLTEFCELGVGKAAGR
jgi:hypothetical protein